MTDLPDAFLQTPDATPKSVLLLHPFVAGPGGIKADEQLMRREQLLAQHLTLNGHKVDVASLAEVSTERRLLRDGVCWRYLPHHHSSQPSKAIISSLLRKNPDILIVKGAGTKLGELTIRRHHGATVLICGGKYRVREAMSADIALTETSEQSEFFRRLLPIERVIALPKLVDDAFTSRRESPAEPTFDVIVVSNFFAHKNHRALLPLAELGLRSVFVGDGPLRYGFEKDFNHNLRGTALFTGTIPPGKIADLLHRSRVLVHPSLSEGFPRAVAEALVVGLPVVAIDGVVGDPVVNGTNGILVRHPRDLPAATTFLLDNPHVYRSLAKAAQETGRARFSQDALSTTLLDLCLLLESDLGSPRTASPVRSFRRLSISTSILTRTAASAAKRMLRTVSLGQPLGVVA